MNAIPLKLALAGVWIVTVAGAFFAGNRLADSSRSDPAAASLTPGAVTFPSSPGGGSSAAATASGASPAGGTGDAPASATGAEKAPRDVRELIARARLEFGGGRLEMFNPSAMLRAFSPLVDLSVDEVKSALEEVEATVTDPQQKAIFLSMLLGRWAEEDPKAAIVYAEKTVDDGGPMAGQALFTVVGPWARKDPEAAWEWYQKKRESDDFSNGMMGASMYLNAIFSGMASRDLDGAIDRLLQLEDDQDRMMAASGIALSSTDSKARQRFLDRTASLDEETRKTLRQGIVSQWAMMEADKAMDWVRALPAEERSSLLDSVSYSFMMGNPEKGAAFLLEDATEENLPRRYALIVNSWANRNPNAAGEWLNRQPPGPAQDEARGSFAMTVSRRDPESAMEWAKTISDENRRFGSIQMVYMQWAKKDPAAAEAALDAAGLPAERLQSIRQSAASNNNNNNRATPAPTLRRP